MTPHDHGGTRCPEPDLLVGWAEGRLTDVEAEALEAHLARCFDCREEVALLGDRSTSAPLPDLFSSPRPAGGGTARPRILRSAIVLAAAAVLLYASLRTWSEPEERLSVVAAVASERADLFGPSRSASAEPSPEWFLGVRATEPCHVALVALDSSGAARPVPLDRSGAFSLPAEPGTDLAVGPYPRVLDPAADLRVVAALLIASPDPLPADWNELWLEPVAGDSEAWARALSERGAPTVVVTDL